MSVPSLTDLITAPTPDEVKGELLSALEALGFPVSSWETDGVAMQIVTATATIQSMGAAVQTAIASGGFLDLAAALKRADGTDDPAWITLLAVNLYDVTPLLAQPAAGSVTLSNSTASPIVVAPGDLQFTNLSGYTYTNTSGGTVAPSGTLAGVSVVADQPGTTGTAAANDLSISHGPSGLTGTNPSALVGVAAWSNDRIATACRQKLATLSPNGAAGAYLYFSTIADDGAGSLGVNRVGRQAATGTGDVSIYAATASGPLSGLAAPPATSGSCYDLYLYLLGKCVPDAVTLTVSPATTYSLTVTATVYVSTSGLTEAACKAALATFFSTFPIGGYYIGGDYTLPVSAIYAVLAAQPGVVAVEIAAPAADVTLLLSDCVVLNSGASSITISAV